MNCGVHCEMQTFVNNWMSECVPACGIGLGQGCFMVRMHASAAYMFNFAAVLVWWQMTCLSNTWHAELHCFFLQCFTLLCFALPCFAVRCFALLRNALLCHA